MLAIDAAHFELGVKWKLSGDEWVADGDKGVERDPYVLFVERCLEMLEGGGTLAIVLPETVFHAPTLGYLRQYLQDGNNIVAIVDLPHNTFRPHCNAKTCLLVLKKGRAQQESIVIATPEEMGHDHTGRALYKPDTDEEWDDLEEVWDELDDWDDPDNKHVFSVSKSDIETDILVPRFYRGLRTPSKCQTTA